MSEDFRKIPAVGDAIHWPEFSQLFDAHPRSLITDAISKAAGKLRNRIKEGKKGDFSKDAFVAQVVDLVQRISTPKLRKVINATGIIVHTNLGRSVLAKEAVKEVAKVASSYSTLEYDLKNRARGSRHSLVFEILCELTGAEAAMVVNNNAAAVFLSLNTLAQGQQVIVSRGELVEIGGSFRVPDIMAKSGCELVEVGTTNKTHPHDYRNAVTDKTGLFLKVHTSNYRIMGFSTSVSGEDLTQIGKEFGIPVMEDLGSGFFMGPSVLEARDEPSVFQTVKKGLDIITFSGDKLLGGPQAGIIIGKGELVEKIAGNPIARAVRVDKMTLAALEATLRLYRDPKAAMAKIPTLKMAGADLKVLREKARRLAVKIREKAGEKAKVSMVTTSAKMGGGSLPMLDLPSAAVSIIPKNISVDQLDKALHDKTIPIIGRIEDGRFLVDVRTLLDGESKIVQNTIVEVLLKEIEK